MQVKKTTVSKSKISSELDLFSEFPSLDRKLKEEAAKEVGEFLKEQILLSVAQAKTPVSGAPYIARLTSRAYAKEKKSQGLPGVANLELTGEMLDELEAKPTTSGVEIGIFGSGAPRADGHNNFSGKSKLPTRQFLPKDGQKFKSDIQKKAEQIVRDKIAENIQLRRLDFARVTNRAELISVLKDIFPDFSLSEIVNTITRNPSIVRLLGEFNLMRFLIG